MLAEVVMAKLDEALGDMRAACSAGSWSRWGFPRTGFTRARVASPGVLPMLG